MKLNRRRTESGLTLPEVLIASVIGTLITGVLAVSLVLMFKTDASTTRRLALSHDRQLVSTYFQLDVQSASATDVSTVNNSTECGARPRVVLLGWTDSAGVTYSSAYCVGATGNVLEGDDMIRVYKAGSAPAVENAVAHHVKNGSPVATVDGDGKVTLTARDADDAEWKITATPRSSLDNPAAPVIVTPGPTPTTTTAPAPTTTTTVPVACTLTQAVATNKDVFVVKKSGSKNLDEDIIVTVKTTSTCSGLKLEVTKGDITTAVPLPGSNGTFGVTLSKNDTWPVGDVTLLAKTNVGVVLTGAANPKVVKIQ